MADGSQRAVCSWYAGIPDPYKELKAPADGGIYRMNLHSGDSKLILPYKEIVGIPHHGDSIEEIVF